MRDWTARQGTVTGVDLDAFHRVQGARASRMGTAYGVGVLTGRPMADGRHLVALDIDGDMAAWRRFAAPGSVPRPADLPHGRRRLAVAVRRGGRSPVAERRRWPPGHRAVRGRPPGGGPTQWARLGEAVPLVRASGGHRRPAGFTARMGRERPALAPVKAAAEPAVPVRSAADVERNLRLRGVSAGLRGALAAAYTGGDRSDHWCRLTASLLRDFATTRNPRPRADALRCSARRPSVRVPPYEVTCWSTSPGNPRWPLPSRPATTRAGVCVLGPPRGAQDRARPSAGIYTTT